MRRFFEAAFAPGGQTEYVGKNVHIGSYSVTVDSVLAEGGFAMVYLVNAKLANAKSSKAALKVVSLESVRWIGSPTNQSVVFLNGTKLIISYWLTTIVHITLFHITQI